MIAILDYAAGNLPSVANAVRHLGSEPLVTKDPATVRTADRIIFPGVGAAGAAMENLRELGLDAALREAFDAGKPILGICLGCQVIFSESDEDGGTSCLGLIAGKAVRFRFAAGVERKVPHMGWNEVRFERPHPILERIPSGSQFYFVHSYYPQPAEPAVVCGVSTYGGVDFPTVVAARNLAAVQFHTEKSGPIGLQLLENFLRWRPEGE